jgi:hypothetical protein
MQALTRDTLALRSLTTISPQEAEQFIERQIRRKIQYRWILRQNSGEELPLPSGPIPALKTHGSISGSVTTTVTIHLWCLS